MAMLLLGGCASSGGGDPYKTHQRMTIESAGVPHSGYYDSRGLWHGGSYDDHHVYHEDDRTWGQRNDPDWSAHFH
jgi:hypothetical protein